MFSDALAQGVDVGVGVGTAGVAVGHALAFGNCKQSRFPTRPSAIESTQPITPSMSPSVGPGHGWLLGQDSHQVSVWLGPPTGAQVPASQVLPP